MVSTRKETEPMTAAVAPRDDFRGSARIGAAEAGAPMEPAVVDVSSVAERHTSLFHRDSCPGGFPLDYIKHYLQYLEV
jgi:hypothetical protein